MKGLDTSEDLEMFMLQHGEKIIDKLGEEVDRIEKNLKVKLRGGGSSKLELSNKYQHNRVQMFFSKIFASLCVE